MISNVFPLIHSDTSKQYSKKIHYIADLARSLAGVADDESGINLGSFRLADNPTLAAAICERLSNQEGWNIPTFEAFRHIRQQASHPPQRRDVAGFRMFDGGGSIVERKNDIAREALYQKRLKQWEQSPERHWHRLPANTKGYIEACASLEPALTAAQNFSLDFSIPLEALKRHSLILGASGSGKTQTMALIIHEIVKRRLGAVVVVDPHGDFARQIGRFAGYQQGQLVYLDPSLDPERRWLPALNPLETTDRSTEAIAVRMESLIAAFGQIIGASFSAQMETSLKPILTALLMRGGSRLSDLMRFLQPKENADLVQGALASLTNENHRRFLAKDWHRDAYNPTRTSLETRLNGLLGSEYFARMLDCERSSFDLEDALADRKTIIFALPKGVIGELTSKALGCFVLARLQSFALRQQTKPPSERTPVFVFVDEGHNFVTPALVSLLAEARKFGLHLTLATQFLGQGEMDDATAKALRTNTNIRIAGMMEPERVKLTAGVLGIDEQTLASLGVGEFVVRVGSGQAVKIAVANNLIRQRCHYLAKDAWSAEKRLQIKQFYTRQEPPQAPKQGFELPSSPATPEKTEANEPFTRKPQKPLKMMFE